MDNLCLIVMILGFTAGKADEVKVDGSHPLVTELSHRIVDDILEEPSFRLAQRDPLNSYRWRNGHVPYTFDHGTFKDTERAVVVSAMREIEDTTKSGDRYCIRFTEWNEGEDFTSLLTIVNLTRPGTCSATLAAGQRHRLVLLDKSCFEKGIIMHELMHSLGFRHEQIRPDRDEYIVVNASNTDSHTLKVSGTDWTTQDFPYDYGSIMQYGPYNSAKDKSWPTFYPKKKLPSGVRLGQLKELSKYDVLRVQRYYGCPENTTNWENKPRIQYSFYCDFEDGLCNMTQATDDDFNWRLGSKGGCTPGTGPNRDYTTGSGMYLVASADKKRAGSKARIRTPIFMEPGRYCLRLALYFYGSDIGEFTIRAEYADRGTPIQFRGSTLNGQRNFWRMHDITVNARRSWRPLIEAQVGNGIRGDIAIDDLSISAGDCV